MGFLAGKRALIVGIASNRSIAWGVAQAMAREGAELAFSYQGDKLQARVEKMGNQVGAKLCVPMDVSSDEEIDSAFAALRENWDGIDVIVHSVGFAPREQLEGRYLDAVTREGVPGGARYQQLQFRGHCKGPAAVCSVREPPC